MTASEATREVQQTEEFRQLQSEISKALQQASKQAVEYSMKQLQAKANDDLQEGIRLASRKARELQQSMAIYGNASPSLMRPVFSDLSQSSIQ